MRILTRLMFFLCFTIVPARRMRRPRWPASSGTPRGVLPGVTVEAASPALIEKARTAVTDGTGQYRIPI